MPDDAQTFDDLWRAYVAAASTAQNEDSLKHPLQTLIEGLGAIEGRRITTGTEADGVPGARPDIAVREVVDGQPLLLGWIELKKPAKRLPISRGYSRSQVGLIRSWDPSTDDFAKGTAPTKHDSEQWTVLSDLPNLVYCNGFGIARYESGTLKDTSDTEALHEPDHIVASFEDVKTSFKQILGAVIGWKPTPPKTMRQLAAALAPLTRTLRLDLEASLRREDAATIGTKAAWTSVLVSGASDADFADGYAQAVAFAVLFARLDGAPVPLTQASIKQTIEAEHSLLFQVVERLGDTVSSPAIKESFNQILRYIDVVNNEVLERREENPWHDFYEFFIERYDPARRNNTGVYFTPKEIVDFQVEQCHEALLEMGFDDSFASEGVQIIDPATGSGTYLLSVIKRTRRYLLDRYGEGIGDDPAFGTQLSKNIHAMEIGVGAYSIAQLRVGRAIADMTSQETIPPVNVYLADTLSDPWADETGGQLRLFLSQLADEQEKANQVKRSSGVRVILGNPPYDRAEGTAAENSGTGGWVRNMPRGDDAGQPSNKPLMDDFYSGSLELGFGREAAKALPNLYVYFWRWALWKAFEQHDDAAIVSFVCPTGFLTGGGASGMRSWLRAQADEIITIDLLGSRRDSRRSYNLFSEIKTPVGVTTARRTGAADKPALAPWPRIVFRGTTEERLEQLREWTVNGPGDLARSFIEAAPDVAAHEDVLTNETATFRATHHPLTNLLGFHRNGVKAQRTWVYAETMQVANERWEALVSAEQTNRGSLLGSKGSNNPNGTPIGLLSAQKLSALNAKAPGDPEGVVKVQYRPLDEHFLVADARVLARPSRDLWSVQRPDQQYFVSRFISEGAGKGPVALLTGLIPDLDCSNPSNGGGADVAPLYRSAGADDPNVHPELLAGLAVAYNQPVSAEDVFFYLTGLMGTGAYADAFWDELEMSVPRAMFPRNAGTFSNVVGLGREVAHLTTNGRIGDLRSGFDVTLHPFITKSVSEQPKGDLPDWWSFDSTTSELTIEGRLQVVGVTEAVMSFQYMGKRVVESWLDYRMMKRKVAGRANTTPLDSIRPTWTPQEFSLPLKNLLITVHHLLALEPEAAGLIEDICSDLLSIELRPFTDSERKPIRDLSSTPSLLS